MGMLPRTTKGRISKMKDILDESSKIAKG